MRRKAILPWTYGFFILNLAVFAALVLACPGNIWTARSFYVWLSVFNLLTVSVAWSVLSDVMKPGQMKRLFALIASGSSLGAMTGPAGGGPRAAGNEPVRAPPGAGVRRLGRALP